MTDANLALGRINPEYFLGGRMKLDVVAARAAVAKVAGLLGLTTEETALAIVRIVDNNMVGALRTVLIERGLDPRDFVLCAFGGATPLHCERADPRDGNSARHRAHPSCPVLGLWVHHDQSAGRPAAHNADRIHAL